MTTSTGTKPAETALTEDTSPQAMKARRRKLDELDSAKKSLRNAKPPYDFGYAMQAKRLLDEYNAIKYRKTLRKTK